MMISDITIQDVKDYLRIEDTYDDKLIGIILDSAKQHIKSHIGLNDLQLDEREDLTIALMVLCHEMYDNRRYTNTNTNRINKSNMVIDNILNKYCTNLL